MRESWRPALAQTARATVNCRVLPWDDLAAVDQKLRELVGTPTDAMNQAARGARAGDDRPVAWSQDAEAAEPVPYTGPEHISDYGRESTGFGYADDERYGAQAAARLPWYKRTALVLSVVGAAAAVLVAVVLALTLGRFARSEMRSRQGCSARSLMSGTPQ